MGIIALILYIVFQTGISLLSEYLIQKNKHIGNLGKKTRIIRIAFYILLGLLPVLGAFLPKCSFKYFCMRWGNVWLGFFMYYSALILFLTLVGLVVSKVKKDKEKRSLRFVMLTSFVIASVLFAYGIIHARSPKVVRYDVSINKQTEGI